MSYDAARRRIVLFGGNAGALLNDTWEWDGRDWTHLYPGASPSARSDHAMAYDAARRRIVLFGGNAGALLNDTWEWDGTTWTRRKPLTSPSARGLHAMAYDAAKQRIVLFGGQTATLPMSDTWEWDGSNWTQLNPAAVPSVRYAHGLAYDGARQRTILFGGASRTTPNQRIPDLHSETYEWDGKTWIQRIHSVRPWERAFHSMTYDPVRGAVMLFGGNAIHCFADVWAYAPTDLSASTHLVSVATGGNVKLSLDAGAAHAARNYWVLGCMDSGGPRGIPSLKINLRLNPDPYFWFTTYVPNPLIANSLGTLDTSGKATATIHVPPLSPALIGWRLYHAYVVFQSSIDYASTPVPLTLVP